jgi:hypothetical protein
VVSPSRFRKAHRETDCNRRKVRDVAFNRANNCCSREPRLREHLNQAFVAL